MKQIWTRLLAAACLCLLGATALAQDIQSIVERNPFDPDRGKKDDADQEQAEEAAPEVDPDELPSLNGTMIIGDTKIAIFSYVEAGKPVTARVVLDDVTKDYTLHLRGEEISEQRNGRLAGYKINDIHANYVEFAGGDSAIKIKMHANRDKKRGGSKKAAAKTPQRVPNRPKGMPPAPAGEPKVTKLGGGDKKADDAKAKAKAKAKIEEQQKFNRRRQPPAVRDAANTKRDRLKKKF